MAGEKDRKKDSLLTSFAHISGLENTLEFILNQLSIQIKTELHSLQGDRQGISHILDNSMDGKLILEADYDFPLCQFEIDWH